MQNSRHILKQIIDKGGMFGACAKYHFDDDEKGKQFITECYEQCHNKMALDFWGAELVSEIIKYQNKNLIKI